MENVDFVIITGDFVRHGTDALPNPMNTTQHILSTVSDLIKKYHPTIPVIASLGNNDVTPDLNGAGHISIDGNGYTGFIALNALRLKANARQK